MASEVDAMLYVLFFRVFFFLLLIFRLVYLYVVVTLAVNRNIKYYYYLCITSSGFKITAIAVYKKHCSRVCVCVFFS